MFWRKDQLRLGPQSSVCTAVTRELVKRRAGCRARLGWVPVASQPKHSQDCCGPTLYQEPLASLRDGCAQKPRLMCLKRLAKVSRACTEREFLEEGRFLLFLQGAVLKFYCWFWEQFILKLSRGRKERNHNLG